LLCHFSGARLIASGYRFLLLMTLRDSGKIPCDRVQEAEALPGSIPGR
jgi:hypothetical protein